MRQNHTLMILALAAAFMTGCAKNDMQTSRAGHGAQPAPDDVRDETPPKILPETHFRAGQLFESQGQFGKALVQYQKAVATNHNYTEGYHRLGLLHDRMGQHKEAVEALTRASDLDPGNATFENNLGFAYAQMRDWEAAERHFRKATMLRPDFDRATINLAMALSRLGQHEQAFNTFLTCLPESDAYYNMGLLFRAQGLNHDAAYAFGQALKIDPHFAAASRQYDELSVRYALGTPLQTTVNFGSWGRQLPERFAAGSTVSTGASFASNSAPGTTSSLASTITGTETPRYGRARVYSSSPTITTSLRSRSGSRTQAGQLALLRESTTGQSTLAMTPATFGARQFLAGLSDWQGQSTLAWGSSSLDSRRQGNDECEEQGQGDQSSLASTIVTDSTHAGRHGKTHLKSSKVPSFYGKLHALNDARRATTSDLSEKKAQPGRKTGPMAQPLE